MSKDSKLSQYKVLIFDVYGTLIDWETGILNALQPLLAGTLLATRPATLLAFDSIERGIQARYPEMRYSELLARVHAELETRVKNTGDLPEADGNKVSSVETDTSAVDSTSAGTSASVDAPVDPHTAFGQSIGQWPIFPDTIPALTELSKHYALTVLSNVDRASFAATQRALEGPPDAKHFAFNAIYTAEDAGAYKPDPRARAYALKRIEEELGYKAEEVIVVANSVFHDITPSRKIGLATAWIDRDGALIGKDQEEGKKATFVYKTVDELAEAIKKEKSSQ